MILLERLEVRNVKLIQHLCLDFPKRGAVLIEGLNESGKSTLFESIYFALYGQPLVGEETRATLDTLITHGKKTASVDLHLCTDDTQLQIHREVTAGKRTSTRARLRIETSCGVEEVSGPDSVNRRIISELGGLDGPALLNSCFVEQKKISRVEDLDRHERRASLMKILNLEQLARLEQQYKALKGDEEVLATLSARLELAEARDQARALREEAEGVRRARQEDALTARERGLEEARQQLRRAERRRAALEELADAEAEANSDGDARLLEQLDSEVSGLRRSRPRLLLGAAALTGVLLVIGLLALRSSAVLGIACIVLAVAVGGIAAAWFVRTGGRIRVMESEATQLRASIRARAVEIAHLRQDAALAAGEAVGVALRRADTEVGAAQSRFATLTQSEAIPQYETSAELVELEQQLGLAEARAQLLERRLGISASEVDVDTARREYEAAREQLAVKERAGRILVETRERILERVLPETVLHMRLILPMLTAGRYHDAQIDDDYRIRVWDNEAGRYVGKNLFSGGTRDQVSLALRLAFAIASLPQERGTSPGFLFLDEPLSAFDDERTRALIELITEGQLSQLFPQIYIISHSKSFDSSLFAYTVRMDDGRIRESNL